MMPSAHAMLLTVLSVVGLIIMSVSGIEVAGNALMPRVEPCGSPSADCGACGADFVACGVNTCFNSSAGETCCDAASNWVCPGGTTCSGDHGQCLSASAPVPAPAPEASTTMTVSTTMTTTSTATSTIPGVATSAPADTYGPVIPSSAPLPPSSAPAPPPSAPAPPPPPPPPVADTTTVIPGQPNSTYAPTIETTSVLSNTTWITSTALTIVANTTVPLVTSTSSSAAPTLPHASTSTTVLTPVSTATQTAAATSSAAPTSAASNTYVELGFWRVVGLVGVVLSAIVCRT